MKNKKKFVGSGPVLENTKKNQNSDSAVEIQFDFLFQPPFSNFDLDQKNFFLLKFANKISRSGPQDFSRVTTSILHFIAICPEWAKNGLIVFRP